MIQVENDFPPELGETKPERYAGFMHQPSSPVQSRQTEPHPRLVETVEKHSRHPWRKPVADFSKRTFEALDRRAGGEGWAGRLILDTGCGTGMSTGILAKRFPGSVVLGVDKSQDRLGKGSGFPDNAVLVRADLEDLWILAHEAGWTFVRQCFYYPNPWPKPEQRLRRWPFHPVLPTAVACGGTWELRTNWGVYAQEFAVAFGFLTGVTPEVHPWNPTIPETLFERKYLESGHSLWRWEGVARQNLEASSLETATEPR